MKVLDRVRFRVGGEVLVGVLVGYNSSRSKWSVRVGEEVYHEVVVGDIEVVEVSLVSI
jgi:hypothetical protein